MKKIILIEWDMKLGPKNIIQFPPEETYPSKEQLFKIWARHKLSKQSNFISYFSEEEQSYFCSISKNFPTTNRTYLIILELFAQSKVILYQEILESIAEELINNIGTPQFSHILADTYRTIINQSEMDEEQLFFRLFQDKNRITILQILRRGVISRRELERELMQKWGSNIMNLDLLLSPFLLLGIIQVKDVPGAKDSIFLIQDVYCCRFPPKFRIDDPKHLKLLSETLELESILPEETNTPLMRLMQESGVKELIALIMERKNRGIEYDVALEIVKNNEAILLNLKDYSILTFERQKPIYLLTTIGFQRFKPNYLHQFLCDRYLGEEISFDQLLGHVAYLE